MAKREFTITAGPDGLNREEVVQALLDAEAIMHREGGAFTVTSIRVKLPNENEITRRSHPHIFETVGYVFRHEYMPHLDWTGQAPEASLPDAPPEDLPGLTFDQGKDEYVCDNCGAVVRHPDGICRECFIEPEAEQPDVPPGLEEQTTALDQALDGLNAGSPA